MHRLYILISLVLAGCSSPTVAVPQQPAYGSLQGNVKAPIPSTPPETINQESDPFCATLEQSDQSLLVGPTGGLKNAGIRIYGLPDAAPPSDAIIVRQQGCSFQPRIVPLIAGQILSVTNDDKTFHNVRTYRGTKPLFSIAHPPGAPPISDSFQIEKDNVIHMKCDIHPWMRGAAVMHNNSFLAITDKNGHFSFQDVPVGTWKVEAWHETLGTIKGEIKIDHEKSTNITLTYP